MNPKDSERLEIAYRAWHADRISDTEIELGVRRVTRAMRGHRRFDPAKRVVSLGAAGLALCAALAYGATGGGFRRTGPAEPSASETPSFLGKGVRVSARRADAASQAARARSESESAAEVAPESEAAGGAPEEALSEPASSNGASQQPNGAAGGAGGKRPAGAARPAAGAARGAAGKPAKASADAAANSWREVGQALEAEDESRAHALLKDLATASADASTRAKAQLGLAQLAVSRGECERASEIALGVARSPGVDEKLVKRAHNLLLRCERR
jgi:hypothetical protein